MTNELRNQADYIINELHLYMHDIRDVWNEAIEAAAKIVDVTVTNDEYLTAVLESYAAAIRALKEMK